MVALGAEFTARGPGGARTIPAESFFVGPLTTALQPTEILTEIRVPQWPAGSGHAFLELWRTHGNFAIIGAAALLLLDGGGQVSRASIVLCGVGPTPVRARQAEASLVGQTPSDARLQEAARLASAVISPVSDVHASTDYRRRTAAVYVRRALTAALNRARGGK
jgi:CO/xanthine dehydrogenase FAD-binding subunit